MAGERERQRRERIFMVRLFLFFIAPVRLCTEAIAEAHHGGEGVGGK